jgi:chaperone modulatory protein CbpM
MSGERILVHGQLYLTLQDVAECYHVELAWVRDVVDFGLLGRCERTRGTLVVAASKLDRVADILRLQRQQGLNLAGVALLLGLDEEVP